MQRMLKTIETNLKQKGGVIERMRQQKQILEQRDELKNLSAEVCQELEVKEDNLIQLRQQKLSLSIHYGCSDKQLSNPYKKNSPPQQPKCPPSMLRQRTWKNNLHPNKRRNEILID